MLKVEVYLGSDWAPSKVIFESVTDNGELSITNYDTDNKRVRTTYAAGIWKWVTSRDIVKPEKEVW